MINEYGYLLNFGTGIWEANFMADNTLKIYTQRDAISIEGDADNITGVGIIKAVPSNDLNNATTGGYYTYITTDSNNPLASANGRLVVVSDNTNFLHQIATPTFGEANVQFYREKRGGVWGTWQKNRLGTPAHGFFRFASGTTGNDAVLYDTVINDGFTLDSGGAGGGTRFFVASPGVYKIDIQMANKSAGGDLYVLLYKNGAYFARAAFTNAVLGCVAISAIATAASGDYFTVQIAGTSAAISTDHNLNSITFFQVGAA